MRLLTLCLVILTLSGCGLPKVKYNYPQTNYGQTVLPNQQNYPNEVLATDDFKVSYGPWFDLEAAQKEYAADKEFFEAATPEIKAAFENNLPSKRVKTMSGTDDKKSAFLELGFWINPKVEIHFQRSGGLTLSLTSSDGRTAEVKDLGCLFVYKDGTKVTFYDSARGSVTFNRDYNNRPDYRKRPNVVYVRLDPQYYQWKVTGLALDNNKIFVQ